VGRDGYTGLVVLAASVGLFWARLGLERNPMIPVGPAFYPRLVLGATAALGALLLVMDLLARRRGVTLPPAAARPNYALVAVNFAVFAAYAGLLPWIGFRLATFAFLVAMQATLDRPRGARRLAIVLAIAAVATAVIYYAFEHYLMVLLPRGRWTGF